MRWARVAATGMCGLALASSVAVGAQLYGDKLGLWEAVLVIGDGSVETALERWDRIDGIIIGLAKDLRIDGPSKELLRTVRDAALELDLERLYNMFPRQDGVLHRVDILGTPSGRDHYDLTLYPTDVKLGQDAYLGRLESSVMMYPSSGWTGKGAQAYVTGIDFELGTGPITHFHVRRIAQIALEEIYRVESSVDPEAALAASHAHFPNTTKIALTYLNIENKGTMNQGVHDMDMRVGVNGAALNGFGTGALGGYIQNIDKLLSFRLGLVDAHGHKIVTARVNGGTVRVELKDWEGSVVPYDNDGAYWDEAIVPVEAEKLGLGLVVSGKVRYQGVIVDLDPYIVPMRYHAREGRAGFNGTITTKPDVHFAGEGRMMGWLVGMASGALNLEGHAQSLFQAMAEGPDGKGSKLQATWHNPTANENAKMDIDVDTKLVDNALVRLGMDIVGNVLVPNDNVLSDALDLFSQVLEALSADYKLKRDTIIAVVNNE